MWAAISIIRSLKNGVIILLHILFLFCKNLYRFRGQPNCDSGSDGENESHKQDIIDIETVKPPDVQGILLFWEIQLRN